MSADKKTSLNTRVVRASVAEQDQHGAVMPPIYLSSNYTFKGFDEKREYDYSRSANPTRNALAAALADLEGGAGAVVTPSGMGALTVLCQLLGADDLIVAPHDCYGGTHRLLTALSQKGCFRVAFVDQTDDVLLADAIAQKPKLVLVETPSNPLLRVTDIEKVCRLAKAEGALVAVDNTFLSPALQRPIELGADIVVHSTTKYLNGHSDVVGGAIVAATDELAEKLAWWANCLGLTGGAFDSYLTLRGMRTLNARMRIHLENAAHVVNTLVAHPAIETVYYPGLSSHPGHDIAARQQKGFGSIISFTLKGGEVAVRQLIDHVNLFILAESLGGVESLICHPATMTHAGMDADARAEAGVGAGLIRLSVGIEDKQDIEQDLRRALDAIQLA